MLQMQPFMKNSIISPAISIRSNPTFVVWSFLAAAVCGLCLGLAACSQPTQGTQVDDFMHPPTKSPTATLVPPKEIDLSQQLDAQGQATAPLKLEAPDGCLSLEIDQGTTVLTAAGKPATRLVIQQDYPGKLPMEAYGVSISYAYRFGPDELRFSAPVKIIFSCFKNYQQTLVSQASVGLQGDDGKWDQLSVKGDEKTIWTRLESLQPGVRYLLVGPAPMGS